MDYKTTIGKTIQANDFHLRWEDLVGKAPTELPDHIDFLPYDIEDNLKGNPFRRSCGKCYACKGKTKKLCSKAWDYELYLLGHNLQGRKTVILIRGIEPYFDVEIPDDFKTGDSGFQQELESMFTKTFSDKFKIKQFTKMEVVDYYNGDKYNPGIKKWIRIYFQNKTNRDQNMKLIRDKYHCSIGSPLKKSEYHVQVASDNDLTYTGWLRLKDPRYCEDGKGRVKDHIDFYETTIDKLSKVPKEEYTVLHKNPRSLIVAFDNENQSQDGQFPRPAEEKKDFNGNTDYIWDTTTIARVPMVGFSLAWRGECEKPFFSFTINDRYVEPNEDMATIVCPQPIDPGPNKTESRILQVLNDKEHIKTLSFEELNKFQTKLNELRAKRAKMLYDEAEKNLLLTFARIMGELSPQVNLTYNGSTFDWPWIVIRAYHYGILEEIFHEMSIFNYGPSEMTLSTIRRWNWRKIQKKMEAGNSLPIYELRIPGFVHVDLMMYLQSIYKQANDISLNAMLRKFGLGGKDDIKPDDIFTAFSKSDVLLGRMSFDDAYYLDKQPEHKDTDRGMAELSHYCVIDCIRTLQLLGKGTFLGKMGEFGNMSFTTYRECWMKADGAKCGYLIRDRAKKAHMLFSDFVIRAGGTTRHTGATVLRPHQAYGTVPLRHGEYKELIEEGKKPSEIIPEIKEEVLEYLRNNTPKSIKEISREFIEFKGKDPDEFFNALPDRPDLDITLPLSALDFASLYPSIMRQFNISPDTMMYTREEAEKARKAGRKVEEVSEVLFEKLDNGNVTKAWKFTAWLIQHEWKLAEKAFPDEDSKETSKRDIKPYLLGIVPRVLDEVFGRRAIKKSELKKINKLIEKMIDEGDYDPEELKNIQFEGQDTDSIQYALKIFMNTMYGILRYLSHKGIYQSAIVTHFGRKCLAMAKNTIEKVTCHTYYGDTDSLYFQFPAWEYKDLILEYYGDPAKGIEGVGTRKEFATKLVQRSLDLIEYYRDMVNLYFLRKFGTRFINMSYEEVLYPYKFVRKKRYAGRQHQGVPNFGPWSKHTMFQKGHDAWKRNSSHILTQTFNEFFERMFDIDNVYSVRSHVERSVRECFIKAQPKKAKELGLIPWETKNFVKNSRYRLPKAGKKGNTRILNFVENVRKERGHRIVPGQILQYVEIKRYPWDYDYFKGNQIKLAGHDFMMLAIDYESDVAEGKNPILDIDKYSQAVIGQFAPYIAAHPDFAEPTVDFIPIDFDKYEEGQSIPVELTMAVQEGVYSDAIGKADARAKAYLNGIASQYSPDYHNKSGLVKSICAMTRNKIGSHIKTQFGDSSWKLASNSFLGSGLDKLLLDPKILKSVDKDATLIYNELLISFKKRYGKDYKYRISGSYNPDSRFNHRKFTNAILGQQESKLSREYKELTEGLETIGLSKEGLSKLNRSIIKDLDLIDNYEEQGAELPELESLLENYDQEKLDETLEIMMGRYEKLTGRMAEVLSMIHIILVHRKVHEKMYEHTKIEEKIVGEIAENVDELFRDIKI